jgi:hypothetical protein
LISSSSDDRPIDIISLTISSVLLFEALASFRTNQQDSYPHRKSLQAIRRARALYGSSEHDIVVRGEATQTSTSTTVKAEVRIQDDDSDSSTSVSIHTVRSPCTSFEPRPTTRRASYARPDLTNTRPGEPHTPVRKPIEPSSSSIFHLPSIFIFDMSGRGNNNRGGGGGNRQQGRGPNRSRGNGPKPKIGGASNKKGAKE